MNTPIALALGGGSETSNTVYVEALSLPEFALEVVRVNPDMTDATLRQAMRSVSGLVLSGGVDVHPARYGETPNGTEMQYVSEARDAMEAIVLDEADRLGLPILAICRGMQMLNVHRGGALLQDIGNAHRDGRVQAEKWRAFHAVGLEPSTRASAALGAGKVDSNSRHHQALDPTRLGRGLRVTGRCLIDDVIEAIEEDGDRFVLGVQWHPENMALGPDDTPERAHSRRLFAAFAEAARRFRTPPA